MTQRSRKLILDTQFMPEWALENKLCGDAFIRRLALKNKRITLPNKLGVGLSYKKIDFNNGVVKPLVGAGSKCVYVVDKTGTVYDVKRSCFLKGTIKDILKKDIESGVINEDKWIVEEKVGSNSYPANDYKFYCFYGKILLVLEVYRHPRVMHCWYNSEGDVVDTGKYEGKLFEGEDFPFGILEEVKIISKSILAPFMRIDYITDGDYCYFNEFTPRPGQYEKFNDIYDNKLGEEFMEAEGRLYKDLLNGKSFEDFKSVYNNSLCK